MKYDVFISYAREDSAAANAIVTRLKASNVSCWIDSNMIAHQHGEEWADKIVVAIEQSKMMVLVFSQHANDSKYVKLELTKAYDLGQSIIPFRLEDVSPAGAIGFYLPATQWLDAFPIYEDHLNKLTESVCRLLDRAGDVGGIPNPVVDWWRRRWANIKHRFRRAITKGSHKKTTHAADHGGQMTGGYGERNRVRDEVLKENLRALASANRWWRIKELIELLEAHQLPLERYAKAKAPLEKNLAAFRQLHDAAIDALGRMGPTKIGPYIEKMCSVIADHPDIDAFQAKISDVKGDRGTLRQTVESLRQQERWTGIENAVRAFALGHGQATASLLHAAEKASQYAIKETKRFAMLAWTVLAGAALLWAIYGVEAWLGISNGSFGRHFSDSLRAIIVPVGCVLVRFSTAVAVIGFLLAAFGVRHQGTFAGASIGLMILAAAAQMIPWALSLLPGSTMHASATVQEALAFLSCALFAIPLVSALQFAACRLIGASPGLPGFTAGLATLLASYGFMPDLIRTGSFLGGQDWSHWLPDGFACAALLASSGVITRRKVWWLLPVLSVGLGVLGPVSQQWAGGEGGWSRVLPMIIALVVAGWMATRPNTLRGYAVLIVCACASCFAAESLRGIDARYGMMPYGRLAPMLSLWAIACGTVAIKQKKLLASQIQIWDMIAKQILRIRCIGSEVRGPQLAETPWFRDGRDWHSKQQNEATPIPSRRP